MQTVPILTAQNVTIEYETASVGERMLAATVDYIILFAYGFAAVVLYFYIERYVKKFEAAYFLLTAVPVFCYDFICEATMDGRSFGKMLIGLKVVKLDGTRPSLVSYLLRWVLRIVDIALFFGMVAVLTILINGKGQRLGDIAAGTSVIRLKQRAGLGDTILVPLDSDYSPVFPEAKRLDDLSITILKEVLGFEKRNHGTRPALKMLERTKAKLEGLMGIESSMRPKEFLETILADYNYYQGRDATGV
jgi:uncharacterized RDD family membrane protein YckC